MQLEAIYDDGKLEFCRPVRFAHGRFPVRVEVPEAELVEPKAPEGEEQLGTYARSWLHRLEAIRAEGTTTQGIELQQVSDEQLERLRMIAMREEH
jgi:hypothetical protein